MYFVRKWFGCCDLWSLRSFISTNVISISSKQKQQKKYDIYIIILKKFHHYYNYFLFRKIIILMNFNIININEYELQNSKLFLFSDIMGADISFFLSLLAVRVVRWLAVAIWSVFWYVFPVVVRICYWWLCFRHLVMVLMYKHVHYDIQMEYQISRPNRGLHNYFLFVVCSACWYIAITIDVLSHFYSIEKGKKMVAAAGIIELFW